MRRFTKTHMLTFPGFACMHGIHAWSHFRNGGTLPRGHSASETRCEYGWGVGGKGREGGWIRSHHKVCVRGCKLHVGVVVLYPSIPAGAQIIRCI